VAAPVSANEDRLVELMAENKKLRASLDKAVKINDKMWNGIVDLHLIPKEQTSNGANL
jgi:pre-rRNA-processing protein IPI3